MMSEDVLIGGAIGGAPRARSAEGVDPERKPRLRRPQVPALERTVMLERWPFVAIAVAVVLANVLYLVGYVDANPFHFRGGLASAITPGPLSGKPWIDPAYAFTSQAIGHRGALDLLHFRLPWWNPYEATGMPLLGETQSAALFPPTLLTAFANGQVYERMLLELIAGICTYLLLRRLGLGRSAATAGAIAYALNGKFAWFADGTINPLPFLPMLLLGIERAYDAAVSGRGGGWRLIAVAGALSVYAGFPEVAYPDTLLGVCWVGWRCTCLARRQLAPFITKAALGAVAGTLLAAPVLLAMGTYLAHADLGIHASNHLGSQHLGSSALPALLMPYVYGQVNGDLPHITLWYRVGGYLSTTLLLFALLGCLAPGRRALKIMLVGWALLVFARMYGAPPLLGHVIGVLPGMSKIQFYRYATAALELPVIVLAAIGLDALVRLPEHRRHLFWAVPTVIAAVVASTLVARPVVHSAAARFHLGTYFHASILWGTVTVAAAAAIALLRRPRARAALLTLLVAGDALVLFIVPEFAAPRATTIDLTPVTYLRHHLGDSRFFTLGPIQPNYGSYFGLASFGIDDFPPKLYARYVHARADRYVVFAGFRPQNQPSARSELMHHLDGYRSAAVRYVLTPAVDPLPPNRRALRLVFRSPTTRIYQLLGASSYFSAAGCELHSGARDSATVLCRHRATLVRRETWFSGWQAQLDGRPTTVRRVDGLFQAVTVPAGAHRVTFSFVPPGMGWAGLAVIAGCMLMLAPTLAGRVRRRLRSPARPELT